MNLFGGANGNLTSRLLIAVCQQQAAPTAAWAEALGERSLVPASIPDLQLSLCPPSPHEALCCRFRGRGARLGG